MLNKSSKSLCATTKPRNQKRVRIIHPEPWTEEEDNLLHRLVRKFGPEKWTSIASNLPGREGKQCRERWHNHLNPEIKKSPWSDYEDWTLFLLHKLYGNRWADFAKAMVGRTDNSIKNHWNSSMQRRLQPFDELLTRKLHDLGTTGITSFETDNERCLLEDIHRKRESGELEPNEDKVPNSSARLSKRPPVRDASESGSKSKRLPNSFWNLAYEPVGASPAQVSKSPYGFSKPFVDKSSTRYPYNTLYHYSGQHDKENDPRQANIVYCNLHESPSK
jgi:hypothetical protein